MKKLALIALLVASVAHADGVGSAGSAGSGSAAGSDAPKKIVIQLPDDVVAPKVSASASPSVTRLGGSVTLFITASKPPGVEVNLTEPIDFGGAFEMRKKLPGTDRELPDGSVVREWQIEITAWELGELQIPELGVTFTSKGKAGQVATNTVPIRVVGVMGDVDDPKLLKPLDPPHRLVARDWFWLWVGSIAAGALVLAFGIYRFARRRQDHTYALTAGSGVFRPKLDMTSERALERLLAIEQSGVLEREDERRAGHVQMFEVIREYLGNRYRVATLDLTTSELVKRLGKIAQVGELSVIESWLDRCDLVRYGGQRPAREAAHAMLVDARSVILATTTRAQPLGDPGHEAAA